MPRSPGPSVPGAGAGGRGRCTAHGRQGSSGVGRAFPCADSGARRVPGSPLRPFRRERAGKDVMPVPGSMLRRSRPPRRESADRRIHALVDRYDKRFSVGLLRAALSAIPRRLATFRAKTQTMYVEARKKLVEWLRNQFIAYSSRNRLPIPFQMAAPSQPAYTSHVGAVRSRAGTLLVSRSARGGADMEHGHDAHRRRAGKFPFPVPGRAWGEQSPGAVRPGRCAGTGDVVA